MFGLFKKKDTHHKLAEKLLMMSQILCHSSTVKLFDSFPALDTAARAPGFDLQRDWDFFFVTATTATGLFIFADERPTEFADLGLAVDKILSRWHQLAPAAIGDFQHFTNSNQDHGIDLVDAVGLWIVTNMSQRAPIESDFPASRAIGELIFTSLRDWHK